LLLVFMNICASIDGFRFGEVPSCRLFRLLVVIKFSAADFSNRSKSFVLSRCPIFLIKQFGHLAFCIGGRSSGHQPSSSSRKRGRNISTRPRFPWPPGLKPGIYIIESVSRV
jgi:hypothetical protein